MRYFRQSRQLMGLGGIALMLGCAPIQLEQKKRESFHQQMGTWIGKPLVRFLAETGWEPTRMEPSGLAQGQRVVEFNALGPRRVPETMTYHHVTEWNHGQVSGQWSTGANQPLPPLPVNASVRKETVTLPVNRSGCRLWLIVDGEGVIRQYRTEGTECFSETLERMKSQPAAAAVSKPSAAPAK